MRKPVKALVLSATLCAGVFVASPASAAAAPYSPEAACAETAGYGGWTNATDGRRTLKTPFGDTFGYVQLMWNGSRGTNCVATIKTAFAGTSTRTNATLRIEGGGTHKDERGYKYYAAVVRKAAGKCVAYSGFTFDTRQDATSAHGGRSSYGNCG
ncbi:hypothetical protein ACFXJ8_28875 [Nonomuraea sp. NPDC059194]|uniref:hypothetical protein n=1 Tax=Nonomuraea sp. NPDC059194 TaxID=3346764 RepID=UPI0036A534A5